VPENSFPLAESFFSGTPGGIPAGGEEKKNAPAGRVWAFFRVLCSFAWGSTPISGFFSEYYPSRVSE